MPHNSNRTASRAPFDTSTINAVWRKAMVVSGVDPTKRRKDGCGAWIDCDQYGRTVENGTGWEIDHILGA